MDFRVTFIVFAVNTCFCNVTVFAYIITMNIPENLQPLVMYGEMDCKITGHFVVIWQQQLLLLTVYR